MKNRPIILSCILLPVTLLFFSVSVTAQTGGIVGKILDEQTGSPLPGANVFLKGTHLGSSSDMKGEYYILNIPPGKYTLMVSYIGYVAKEYDVNVVYHQKAKFDIKMQPNVLEGEVVSVTAQAEGQMQAINQQLSALTIKNVVSKAQIQELPEANAAEAVGRLPGVSLERTGGEGTKLVIRGMSAKYTKVQIDGVNMTATGNTDRSTDLSMISPYMLEGIELTKSVMANQEASATGGIVNFAIKEAPEKPTFNVIAQGGHNNLENRYRDFKLSIGGSKRFFSNQLGIYAGGYYDGKDASSDQFGEVDFAYENSTVLTKGMTITDINRKVQRYGATLVIDYSLPLTRIKFTNFSSRIHRDEQQFGVTYQYFENQFGRYLIDNPKEQMSIMTNAIKIEHSWDKFKINSSLSYAYSKNETPEEVRQDIGYIGIDKPFGTRKSTYFVDLNPYSIPDSIKFTDAELVQNMNFGTLTHSESYNIETDLNYKLELSYEFNILKLLKLNFNTGGMYRYKQKEYEQNNYVTHFDWGGGKQAVFRDAVIDYYWDQLSEYNRSLKGLGTATDFRYSDFVDKKYAEDDFLGNRYDFGSVPDLTMFRTIDNMGMDHNYYYHDNIESQVRDYFGNEIYFAWYVMPQFKIGSQIIFIPGVRYESNRTEYTGYRGNLMGLNWPWEPFFPDTAKHVRKNEEFLPMIQLFYEPISWLNIKFGYTHTLQEPDYWDIIPSYLRDRSYIEWRNFRLKPEKAKNIDVQASIFSNHVGLLSLGVFHKKITDMIFNTGTRVIIDPAEYELPSITRFAKTEYTTNNEYDVTNYGYEVEWKSNFWFLPGLLKGLVCNVNYTRNISDAKYLRTRIKTEYDQNYQPIFTNIDTTYSNPMIMQPDHLFNLSVGFDYKGFSVRGAMRFISHIFKAANWYDALRGYSTDFYRYDLALRQKLPVEGLEIFLDLNNLTNAYERDVIKHLGFTSYEEHYGRSANIGLRYKL